MATKGTVRFRWNRVNLVEKQKTLLGVLNQSFLCVLVHVHHQNCTVLCVFTRIHSNKRFFCQTPCLTECLGTFWINSLLHFKWKVRRPQHYLFGPALGFTLRVCERLQRRRWNDHRHLIPEETLQRRVHLKENLINLMLYSSQNYI